MSVDVRELDAFYRSTLGLVARRVAVRAVEAFWPRLAGETVLGLGYATPYLSGMAGAGARLLAFMPARQGAVAAAPGAGPPAALVDPLALPLPDGSVDRVLLAHALETVESPTELLHEVWRVLGPAGRLLVLCPNRRGLWARMDTTPFGHGQPYSRSQLRRLLAETWYAPDGWAEILYVPPIRSRLLLSGAGAWERLGVGLKLPFAGLHVVDAGKRLQRPVPVRARRASGEFSPIFVPAPASPAAGRVAAPTRH